MKTAMAFGTFDRLHPGHLSYLRQAKKYGDYLLVVVARDKTVLKTKGQYPRQDERQRWRAIKNLDFVDKAVAGGLKDKLAVIKKYKPDIVCLGYDQKVEMGKLRKIFSGKIIRLKAYKKNVYKSSKLK